MQWHCRGFADAESGGKDPLAARRGSDRRSLMSLRILHVSPSFYPAWAYGGVPRCAYELCRELVAHGLGLSPEQGFDVGEGALAVDPGLARAEQAQVRAVQEQEVCHKATLAKSGQVCLFSLQIAARYVT